MADRKTDKTFVLGVGTQKAATSWFRRELDSCDYADMGLMKEYHVWDAISDPTFKSFLGRDTFQKRSDQRELRTSMQNDTDVYFDYFDRLCSPEKGIYVTGDVTPSYCVLPETVLRRIADGLREKGFSIRVVFLMRDPVERCWSAVRMNRRNAKNDSRLKTVRNYLVSEANHVALTYKNELNRKVTSYHKAVRNLESAFSPEELYIGIYENMFLPENLEKLSDFVGVAFSAGSVSQKMNSSEKSKDIPEALERTVALYYEDVYKFCAARFPEVTGLWGGFRYLP